MKDKYRRKEIKKELPVKYYILQAQRRKFIRRRYRSITRVDTQFKEVLNDGVAGDCFVESAERYEMHSDIEELKKKDIETTMSSLKNS